MKIITWNVNGLRACLRKGLADFMRQENADVYCFQEIKITEADLNKIISHFLPDGYQYYVSHAQKKGYSGVMTLTKHPPLKVEEGIKHRVFDAEGRVLLHEYNDFFLINSYFPNSQHELKRLDDKIEFNRKIFNKCKRLTRKKPVVICGDFNVAHKEIDLANPKQNENNPGFTIEERTSFDGFLKKGFIDAFRLFETGGGHYTWWSYRFNAREKNIGWRIDYFLVDPAIRKKVKNVTILKDVLGSDHCPVRLELK